MPQRPSAPARPAYLAGGTPGCFTSVPLSEGVGTTRDVRSGTVGEDRSAIAGSISGSPNFSCGLPPVWEAAAFPATANGPAAPGLRFRQTTVGLVLNNCGHIWQSQGGYVTGADGFNDAFDTTKSLTLRARFRAATDWGNQMDNEEPRSIVSTCQTGGFALEVWRNVSTFLSRADHRRVLGATAPDFNDPPFTKLAQPPLLFTVWLYGNRYTFGGGFPVTVGKDYLAAVRLDYAAGSWQLTPRLWCFTDEVAVNAAGWVPTPIALGPKPDYGDMAHMSIGSVVNGESFQAFDGWITAVGLHKHAPFDVTHFNALVADPYLNDRGPTYVGTGGALVAPAAIPSPYRADGGLVGYTFGLMPMRVMTFDTGVAVSCGEPTGGAVGVAPTYQLQANDTDFTFLTGTTIDIPGATWRDAFDATIPYGTDRAYRFAITLGAETVYSPINHAARAYAFDNILTIGDSIWTNTYNQPQSFLSRLRAAGRKVNLCCQALGGSNAIKWQPFVGYWVSDGSIPGVVGIAFEPGGLLDKAIEVGVANQCNRVIILLGTNDVLTGTVPTAKAWYDQMNPIVSAVLSGMPLVTWLGLADSMPYGPESTANSLQVRRNFFNGCYDLLTAAHPGVVVRLNDRADLWSAQQQDALQSNIGLQDFKTHPSQPHVGIVRGDAYLKAVDPRYATGTASVPGFGSPLMRGA